MQNVGFLMTACLQSEVGGGAGGGGGGGDWRSC